MLRGLAWTPVYRIVEAFASFAAMLVLVRVIAPGEGIPAGAALRVPAVRVGASPRRPRRARGSGAFWPHRYATIGLFNGAQALFATTVGRVGSLLVETVYPLMSRYAANLEA